MVEPPSGKSLSSLHQPHAVAPYDKDRRKALDLAFDRDTGSRISAAQLLTYEGALADYHLNTESKFQNGGRFDTGRTERRYVEVLSVVYIGKEADRLEEAFFFGVDTDIEYPASPEGRATLVGETLAAIKKYGRTRFEAASGFASSHLSAILNGAGTLTARSRARLTEAIAVLNEEADEIKQLLDRALAEVDKIGWRPFARELAQDPSNLRRALKPERKGKPPKSLVDQLRLRFLTRQRH